MKSFLILLCAVCIVLFGCGGGGSGSDYYDEGSIGDLGDDDSFPPDDGLPPDEELPPDDGELPPDDGETPPDDGGEFPPDDGELPPDDGGELPPDDGEPPPDDDGELPPDDGEPPPDDDSELPPDDGEPPPDDDGESPPDDNNDDGDDNDDDDNDAPACDYSFVDELWEPGSNPLWFFNAQFYDNRTVRWPNGAVRVRVNDERVDLEVLQTIFDEINDLIQPTHLIIFNNNSSNYDIEIVYSSDWENWGYTTWLVDEGYKLYSAVIEMGDFEDTDCHFYAVLKHQIIQAVGFFNYTEDGGVMTQEIYNDLVTVVVAETLQALYDTLAGTEVQP